MKLAFILGRKHALAIAEILQVLSIENISYELLSVSNLWFAIDTTTEETPLKFAEKLQKRLGGTVKIVEIIEKIPAKQIEDLSLSMFEQMIKSKTKKINIAVSIYGDTRNLPRGFQKNLGMSLKNYYNEIGYKARFAYSGKADASSVTFTKKIKDKGADINFLLTKDSEIYIGKTITAQDFEGFLKRDYGRPMVSVKSGALPPKLAQMMVNLTKTPKTKYIYDPFCGSGTLMQEAIVQGYDAVGSDIDRKAFQQTEQNLGWLKRHYLRSNDSRFMVFHSAVKDILDQKAFVEKFIQKDKIGGVATEPYLGPTHRNIIKKDQNYSYMISRVSNIFRDIFEVMPSILMPGERFVFVLPEYNTTEGWESLDIADLYEKDFTKLDLLDTLPISDFGIIDKLLTWDRPESIIRRNIIVLERKA